MMCCNQLGRRNVTEKQKAALIGEAYKAQKMTRGSNNQYVQAKSEKAQTELFHNANPTATKIAKDFGVARETVKRAEHFLDGLNAAEEVSPGFKTAILSGEVKACYERIWNKPAYKRGCWRKSPTTKSKKKVSSERVWDQPTHQESGW